MSSSASMLDFKGILFSVAHTLNEKRHAASTTGTSPYSMKHHLLVLILHLLDFLSITQLIMLPTIWPEAYNVEFSPLGPLTSVKEGIIFYLVYAIAVCITMFTVVTTVYMGVSFKRNFFISYLPAILLRHVMGTVVTALFVPLVEILIHPLHCYLDPHDIVSCGPASSEVVLTAVSIVVLLLFIPLSAFIQVLYIDNHMTSGDIEACHSGHMNMLDTVVRTASTLLIGLVGNDAPVAVFIIVAVMFFGLGCNIAYTLPYFNMHMNVGRTMLYFMNGYICVISIVMCFYSDARVATIMMCLLPLPAFIAILLPYLRKRSLYRYLPAILNGDSTILAQYEGIMVSVCDYQLDTVQAKALFPGTASEALRLALFTLQTPKVDSKFSGFLLTESVRNAERIFELATVAFPDSAKIRIAYAQFIDGVYRDESRSTGMLGTITDVKCNPDIEEQFWIYSFERTLEHKRKSSMLGHLKQVSGLTLAELAQHQRNTFHLHDTVVENTRKLWALILRREYDTAMLLACVQNVIHDYRLAVSSYESLISKCPKPEPTILRRYADLIRDVSHDMTSAQSLMRYIDNVTNKKDEGEENVKSKTDSKSEKSYGTKTTSDDNDGDFDFDTSNKKSLRSRRMKLSKHYVFKSSSYVSFRKLLFFLCFLVASVIVITGIGFHFRNAAAWYQSIVNTDLASEMRPATIKSYGMNRGLSLAVGQNASNVPTARKLVIESAETLFTSTRALMDENQIFPAAYDMFTTSNIPIKKMFPVLVTNSSTPNFIWQTSTASLHDLVMAYMENALTIAYCPISSVISIPNNIYSVPFQFLAKNQDILFSKVDDLVGLYSTRIDEIIGFAKMSQFIVFGLCCTMLVLTFFAVYWPVVIHIQNIENRLFDVARMIPPRTAKRMFKKYNTLVQLQRQRITKEEAEAHKESDDEDSDNDFQEGGDGIVTNRELVLNVELTTPAARDLAIIHEDAVSRIDGDSPKVFPAKVDTIMPGKVQTSNIDPPVKATISDVARMTTMATEEFDNSMAAPAEDKGIKTEPALPSSVHVDPKSSAPKELFSSVESQSEQRRASFVLNSDDGAGILVTDKVKPVKEPSFPTASAPHLLARHTNDNLSEVNQASKVRSGSMSATTPSRALQSPSRKAKNEIPKTTGTGLYELAGRPSFVKKTADGHPPFNSGNRSLYDDITSPQHGGTGSLLDLRNGTVSGSNNLLLASPSNNSLQRSGITKSPSATGKLNVVGDIEADINRLAGNTKYPEVHRKSGCCRKSPFLIRNSILIALSMLVIIVADAVVVYLTSSYPPVVVNGVGNMRNYVKRVFQLTRDLSIDDHLFKPQNELLTRLAFTASQLVAYKQSVFFGDTSLGIPNGILGLDPTIDKLLVGPMPDLFVNDPKLVGQSIHGIEGMLVGYIDAINAFISRCNVTANPDYYTPGSPNRCSFGNNDSAMASDAQFSFIVKHNAEDNGLLWAQLGVLQRQVMVFTTAQLDKINAQTTLLMVIVILVLIFQSIFAVRLFDVLFEASRSFSYFKALIPPDVTETADESLRLALKDGEDLTEDSDE